MRRTITIISGSPMTVSYTHLDVYKRQIIDGIHRSVAGRVAGLVHRVGLVQQVAMTGGVAQNTGVVHALENELGCKILTSPLTQYNGALGAALFAWQAANR